MSLSKHCTALQRKRLKKRYNRAFFFVPHQLGKETTTMSDIDLQKIYSGKVRDLYAIDDKRMLMVATDRLSAFDVILDERIPTKAEILT